MISLILQKYRGTLKSMQLEQKYRPNNMQQYICLINFRLNLDIKRGDLKAYPLAWFGIFPCTKTCFPGCSPPGMSPSKGKS